MCCVFGETLILCGFRGCCDGGGLAESLILQGFAGVAAWRVWEGGDVQILADAAKRFLVGGTNIVDKRMGNKGDKLFS